MLNNVPKIDRRIREDITRELKELILEYCPEWRNLDDLESNKEVEALIRIFSNMMGNVIDEMNQAPEKNFIAFLNMIGISPTPPRMAEAPIVFKLKGDWEGNGFVPAGTRISAQPENQEEVVFETEKDLTVIQTKLVKAVSIEPDTDKWYCQDWVATHDSLEKEAELFQGQYPIVHRLYLGHSKLFSFKEPVTVELNHVLKQPWTGSLKDTYYYFDEEGNPRPILKGLDGKYAKVAGICPKTLSGYDKTGFFKSWTNNWIYAELETSLTDGDQMPDIEETKIKIEVSSAAPLSPDAALCNDSPLDLTKDYSPFGGRPVYNDTFYFASGEAFSKKDASITINVVLTDEQAYPRPNTQNIRLSWEYWDGSKWKLIADTTQAGASGGALEDTTKGFTSSGTVKFKCPGAKLCNIGGVEDYWVRVRITGGDYGKEGYFKYTPKSVNINGTTVQINEAVYTDSTLKPPSFKEVSISYTYTIEDYPEIVLTENNFSWADRTSECLTPGKYFKPFYPCSDTDPTFYLAFDGDISSLPVSLFFPFTGDQLGENPVVAWEYWNGKRWLALSVDDAIRNFTRSEVLQFAAPSDLKKCPVFGMDYYWIRARLEEGGFRVLPKLSAIYSNVVWASNANTIRDEIMGSSNAEPGQTFQFSRTPVVTGQTVTVRETLGKEEWKEWQEVSTFSISGTDSRHYILDRSTGMLTFGDGVNGMIPPAGVGNIKCNYRYGGGAKGNVKAGLITNMWDSYPSIDSATNPVPSDGGFDQEESDKAEIRGPHTLKSLDRGVTCEDIEWLVREAMPQIAKVKCLPTMDRELRFTPGKATVVLLPASEDPKPVPSQEILNDIDEYLSERTAATISKGAVSHIDIIGPDYIRVGVEATVAYTTPESSKVIEGRIIDGLKQFLNPLHGGQEKTGWDFGKNLYVSEVYSVIKGVSGVDYITNLSIKASVQCYTLNLEMVKGAYFRPAVTYPKYSAVKSSDNRIVIGLAQALTVNESVKTILAKGFKENDIVRLRYRNCPTTELLVLSVDGDVLECRTSDEEPLVCDYPSGSDIEADLYLGGSYQDPTETPDLTIRSYIMNEVTGNPDTFRLKIAIPEARDIVFLGRNDEYTNTTPLQIREVRLEDIFLEEDELVYSGPHLINKKPELVFPYLMDNDADIVHDLTNTTVECRLGQISREDRLYLEKVPKTPEIHLCRYCFPDEG